MSRAEERELAQYQRLGYFHVRRLPSGEIVGLAPFVSTIGLVRGLNPSGYTSRFCYPSIEDAIAAISSWTGDGDPPGPWLKEKGIGIDRANPSAGIGEIPVVVEAG